jgi:Asp-tRNA(Asn)/Glu-tRNA(Gln) amidotransferase A subunit family amidase
LTAGWRRLYRPAYRSFDRERERGAFVTSASEIAEAVASGRRRAIDVIEETLDRIAALNPTVNALIEVRPPEARAAAVALDTRIGAGQPVGPLAGVPLAVKEVLWEAGIEATNGSRSLVGFVPDETAVAVERLVAAGAIVVGRSNIPEFCYRGHATNDLYGATSNPWDLGRVPGGSSGGAGAAVAAGLVPLAIGTDAGGSVRIPASFCGIVGLKPTYGLVPREPQWPAWWTVNHYGPMTFTVLDTALMLAAMAGPDDLDPASLPDLGRDYVAAVREPGDLRGLRIAVSEDLGYIALDDEVRDGFRQAVERFRALGAEIEPAHPALENAIPLWNTIGTADMMASEGPFLATGRVGDDARSLIEAGVAVSGTEYADARNRQYAYTAEWARFMRRYDLLLTPTMECTAFEHGRSTPATIGGVPVGDFFDDWCAFMYPFNLTGQPAITVPMGLATHGMPAGLHIIGRRFEDDLVLRAAAAWERIAPWERPPLAATAAPLVVDETAAVAGARVRSDDGVREVRKVSSPADGQRIVAYV